jgi:8-oxo-dGTP diphosphatase
MAGVRTSPRAIVERSGRYLVARYRSGEGEWFNFPDGGQQNGEDLHEALRRELREEIGAEVRVGELRFVRECIRRKTGGFGLPAEFHQVELFFACELVGEPCESGTCPDTNQVGHAWLTLDELAQRRFFPGGMVEALRRADGGRMVYLGAIA